MVAEAPKKETAPPMPGGGGASDSRHFPILLTSGLHRAARRHRRQGLRQQVQPRGRPIPRHLPGHSHQDKCREPARFLSESALPRSRPHRAVRRETHRFKRIALRCEKNCPELSFLRRSRLYLHPRQIRPQELNRPRSRRRTELYISPHRPGHAATRFILRGQTCSMGNY